MRDVVPAGQTTFRAPSESTSGNGILDRYTLGESIGESVVALPGEKLANIFSVYAP